MPGGRQRSLSHFYQGSGSGGGADDAPEPTPAGTRRRRMARRTARRPPRTTPVVQPEPQQEDDEDQPQQEEDEEQQVVQQDEGDDDGDLGGGGAEGSAGTSSSTAAGSVYFRGPTSLPDKPRRRISIVPEGQATWRVVSEEDSRHVNGVLGALVRHYFPGIVTYAGKDEPAYTWAHYEFAHHATAGNVAAHILQEFWTYFKLDESYEGNADAVARKACRKRVTDMYHEARVQAIRDYYGKQFGESVNKKQIRDRRLSLTKEQFMQVIPWWCEKSPEAWGQIVDRWLSEEWRQQHAAARAHRLAMPGVPHHQGNRNVGGFGRAWSAAHGGQPCSYFAAYTMSHKGKATSDVSFNPEDPPEAYTSESAYKKVTEYHEAARTMYGSDYDPTTDNIDARLVMCLGKGKQHGRYWMANSVIDTATTPTLSQIRVQATSGSGLPPIRERPAYGQAQVEALQAQVETSNKRADELEAVVASERAARLASDQRMSDVLAFLQSSLGVILPPNLMGPPQPPPVVPPFVALNTTPPQSAGSNHVPNEHGGPSPPSHGWPGYQPPPPPQ